MRGHHRPRYITIPFDGYGLPVIVEVEDDDHQQSRPIWETFLACCVRLTRRVPDRDELQSLEHY